MSPEKCDEKNKLSALELLGAVAILGDWFSLAVTAGLIAALVAVGVATHHVGFTEGIRRYLEAMLVSAAIVTVSVGAAKLRARIQ